MMTESFIRNTLERGAIGKQWLDDLPAIVEELKNEWGLTIGPAFDLSFNYVVRVTQHDGTPAVLKIVFPTDQIYKTEIATLRFYNGQGAIQILAVDERHKAMLLEHAAPGTPLSSLNDDRAATSILATTMQRLWKPVPHQHSFPHIAEWTQSLQRYKARFSNTIGPVPYHLIEKADHLFQELIATTEQEVVCHGDLHHSNVLSSKRGWLAIDPQGVIADPAYETAVMLQNPDIAITKQLLTLRIAQLSNELAIPYERIQRWGFAHTVLSAVWCIEDGAGRWCWEGAVEVATLLESMHS
jgi:streptomycin 6-kinase